jgi:hypothetical protein
MLRDYVRVATRLAKGNQRKGVEVLHKLEQPRVAAGKYA